MKLLIFLLALIAPPTAWATNNYNILDQTSGGGTPGGTNGQIQYNNAGSFGGLDSTGTGNVARAGSPTFTGTVTSPALAGDSTGTITGYTNLTPAGTLTDGKLCTYTASGPSIGCTLTAASANTASAVVQRDSSGNAAMGVLTLTGGTATVTIGSGTAALGTSAISSGACATTVTAAVTGALTTDNLSADFNADPTAVTGYGKSATGLVLTIYKWITSGQVNISVCNSTASSITPSAATLQYRVIR